MEFKKYKNALLIFLIYLGVISFFVLIAGENPMSPFIPGDTMKTEIVVVYLISFILGPIIGVLLGFVFGPIFLFIQKKILGRKMNYGIQERPPEKEFKKLLRTFFPALMALNFAMLLAGSSLIEDIVAPTGDISTGIHPIVVIAMLMFTVIISFAIFAGIWFLLDSGLMYTNKDKDSESDQPIETRSVGGFFLDLIEGYAGISVAIVFYEIAISNLQYQKTQEDFIGVVLFLFPIPFFIMMASIPSIILLDIIRKQRITYMRKIAKSYGIIEHIESTWKIKNIE